MSAVSNFSFRQNSRTLVLRSINEHQWDFDVSTLSHMLNNFAVYVEMGGLLGLSYSLRTDTHGGLRGDERASNYEKRIELYGLNKLPLPPVRPLWKHAIEALQDPMLMILIVGGVVSIIANTLKHPEDGWIEGLAILIAVVIVVFVSSYNNHSQEVAFLKLASSLKGSPVTCVRDGVSVPCEQDELMVGDIISLNPGNMIPADGIMIDQTTIRVNESALTGEADECVKTPQWPFLSSGTEIVDGSCCMLVTAVGANSAKGKIMSSLAQEQEQTKLQKRLEHTATMVGYIGMSCAIATFLALVIRWVIKIEGDSALAYSEEWTSLIDFFIISITIIVVAIPEGLPLAVTISLAYSMSKMRADQNLVKVLSACETMGNATTICSDKTGTLTQNKMTVVQMYVASIFYPRQAQKDEIHENVHAHLIDGIVCNSDRRIQENNMDFTVAPEDWKWEGDGGATEAALLSWLSRYHEPPKENIMTLRAKQSDRIMQFYPFSSAKKVSSVIVVPKNNDMTNCRRYYKGAADRVIRQCTSMLNKDGVVEKVGSLKLRQCTSPNCKRDAMRGETADNLTLCDEHSTRDTPFDGVCRNNHHGQSCNKWAVMGEEGGEAMYCTDANHHPSNKQMYLLDQHPMKMMSNMTRIGLRCIAFGYVDNIPAEIKDGQFVDPAEVGDWTLVGLVGIKDPLRLETRDAVMTVQQAGIIVRMVTGDNIDTARFISQDCGIVTHPRHLSMEGADFRMALEQNEAYKAKNGTDNPEFVDLVTNLRVMARCQPEDKLELVKFLKEHDQVVGVTGDGSNDGPALKIAHVGLAMGIAGTDVAKAAADIIILDDNFSSIVRSVMWGRCVYDNIRKFLQFQCAVNLCALVLALVGAIANGKEPLKPVQLLWVNLIMDTMGALALGTENPKPTLLQRKPFHPDANLISPIMWRNIVGQGLVQLAVLFTVMYAGPSWLSHRFEPFLPDGSYGYNEKKHFTFIFNIFVWLQFFNEISSRKVNDELNIMEGFFENAWFGSILLVTAAFQVLMIEVFGSFASTTHQEWDLWLIAIAFGMIMILSGMLLRVLIPISPEHGQIDIPDTAFENAPWIEDPSLTGALFHSKHTAVQNPDDEPITKVVPNHYEPPTTTTALLVTAYDA